jgi:hypothetical protein
VVRLGEERPDVLAGGEQLPGCAIGGHVDGSLLFLRSCVTKRSGIRD